MKQYCIKYLLLLCLLLPIKLMAQQLDITGMWSGELEMIDTANQIVHLPYEIAVSEEKGKLGGYSRIIFHANGKDEAGIQNITIKRNGNQIVMEDEGFVEHDFTINPSRRVKKIMIMTLDVSEAEMVMTGSWSTNRTRYYIPAKGTAVLKRKIDFKSTALFKRLDTLKLAEKLSFKNHPTTTPVTVVATALVEIKPIPVLPAEPQPEPELFIPAIEKASTISLLAVTKNRSPSTKISAPTRQQKTQMDVVTKTVIKLTSKPVPVALKPAPVVAVAIKPEKKIPVVEVPKPAPVIEKKPAVVVLPPKPTPPPVVIVAPSITQGAAELEKRTTKSDQSFYFESDSLVLTLYDNGEVDGDTVTVVMNGNIIFSKQGLSTKANTKVIHIDSKLDSVKLVMYAENLGEIPPNTGLMIILDGEKRYEVRFSADLSTNAAIILRRRKN